MMKAGEKEVLCLEKRYANFIYGKVYLARARAITSSRQRFAMWEVVDEDGDLWTVADVESKLKKNWQWIEERG